MIDKTWKLLQQKYPQLCRGLYISDARVGLNMTAVMLSDGSAGVASTVADLNASCKKNDRYFDVFSPGKINGAEVSSLFERDIPVKVASSLRLAVLNAISSTVISQGNYHIVEDADPIDLIDLQGSRTITLVGAFQSYIRKIASTTNNLFVLELNEEALKEDQKKYFVPAEDHKKVLPISDVVIITGFTLANHTMEELLESMEGSSEIIVVGPSGNLIPEMFFEKGVDIIGATRIVNPQLLLEIVGQGGAGFHLFEKCAKKICILKR